jgi:signal transduction histidine kinase
LPHLMDYLGQYAIQFFQTAGVCCRVDFPDEFPQRTVPPEIRHNLFLAVKEALNNVARHAQATEIWLRVSLARNYLKIVVEDNGKGFNGAPENFCADGLRNMRRRMEEIDGEFQIVTSPDAGTRISLTLQIPSEMKLAD